MNRILCVFVVAAALETSVAGAQMTHDDHVAMLKNQAQPMGFDDTRTTHHFRLLPDGGTIEVHVNDAGDVALRTQVNAHLTSVAALFAHGEFSAPFAVHGEEPAGVPVLKRLRGEITYKFVPDERGGRVVITTASAEALAGVHEFLRYQIREHKTGDALQPAARPKGRGRAGL